MCLPCAKGVRTRKQTIFSCDMIGSFPLDSLQAETVENSEAPEGARVMLTAQGYYEVRRE